MKRMLAMLLIFSALFGLSAAAEEEPTKIYIHVNDAVLTVAPEDNSSAAALLALLQEGDLTVQMHDYAGFEKVGPLPTSFPRNDEQITAQSGDLILYQGNQITLYYDINSWSFTRLGRVEGLTQTGLTDILGGDDITAVFSLNEGPGVSDK